MNTTPALPDFPTRKSLQTKVARYEAAAAAHRAGQHEGLPRQRYCAACSQRSAR